MTFTELLSEILDKIDEYNHRGFDMDKKELQKVRDELSCLSTTLANFSADFFDDVIEATFNKKILTAKHSQKLIDDKEEKTSAASERRAFIINEAYYRDEVDAEKLLNRSKVILHNAEKVINSIASRLNIDK